MKTAFLAALKEAWAITPEMLQIILAVAAGEQELPEALQTKPGHQIEGARSLRLRDNVAILSIVGPIFPRANFFTEISGATSLQSLAFDFGAAIRNPAVDAIVLEIDSPGGALAGVEDFAKEIRAAASIKPITAFVFHQAASAAYWIAAAADEIVMPETANVGSVGVVLGVRKPDDPEKSSVVEFVSSVSPRKRLDATSDAGKIELQTFVDKLGMVFVSEVASYRKKKREDIAAAGGCLLIGADAIKAGFADRIGTMEQVISQLSISARGKGFNAGTERASSEEEMKFAETKLGKAIAGLLVRESAAGSAAAAGVDDLDEGDKKLVADLEKALADEAEGRIADQAKAFAEGVLTANKTLPYEVAALEADYRQAALDDRANPVSGGPSRVNRLKARISAMKAHSLTTEQVIDPAATATISAARGGEEAAELEKLEKQEREYARRTNPKSARA